MQVDKLNNGLKINFNQNNYQTANNNSNNVQNQKDLDSIKALPSNFVNVNTPVKYSKINEFTLPGTDTKVHIYKLSNGQTVVLAPKKGLTQINTYVDTGALNETEDKRGISHYIEHNLFNGSKNIKPKEFFKTIGNMGAYTNAWTSEFATSYMIISSLFDSGDLKKIIEMHSDMVQYPQFEQSQLDKEKGVVNSEITMYDDSNYRVMTTKALKQLFQIKSDSNDIVGGTVANINNLKREDVIEYYNKNYTPDKMMTVLTGEFNPDEAIDLISRNFTKQAAATQPQYNVELNPIEQTKRIDYYSPNINNDEFVISFAGPKNCDLKDIIALKMGLRVLCGNSYSKLDKILKPYNVTPHSELNKVSNKQTNPQFLEINGSCNPDDTQNVLQTIYSVINNSKYENLGEDLDIIKKSFLKNLQFDFETGNTTNCFLGDFLRNYTPEQLIKLPEIINSVTEADVKNTMNKYLDLNKVSIVVSHPAKKSNGIAFKGKLEKKGQDLSEFKYLNLQNNAQVYLQDDKADLKDFIITMRTPLPPNVTPEVKEVLGRILNKGVNNLSEADFEKDLSKKGGSLYFSVGHQDIFVSGNALKDDINYVLARAIDTLNNPKFNQQTLDEVKKQLAKEITEENKKPSDFINEVMYPQEKTSSTKEQKLNALRNVNLGDVLGLMMYLKQNSSLYFGWNKQEIPYMLNNLGMFNPAQKTDLKTYTPLKEDVLKVQSEESGQANVMQIFKFENSNDPKETAKINVLNSILGSQQSSRLFTDLRESQKLAYHTGSYVETYGNTGLIILEIGTTTDNPQDKTATSANITKSLNGFKNNIERLKNEPVTEEELAAAKLNLKSNIMFGCEKSSGRMRTLINDVTENYDADYINKYMKAIDEISIEDVQKTAQKVFDGKSLTSIVASEKTLKELNLQG